MRPSSLPDLITAEELAQALGCEAETIQRAALAGTLPGVKFGRGWVFPREALLEALNRQARDDAARRSVGATPAAVAHPPAVSGSRRRALPKLPELPSQG